MTQPTREFNNLLSRLKWFLVEKLTPIVTYPKFFDIITQIMFMGGLIGIAGIGIVVAIPYQYTDESYILKLRIFGFFIIFQLIVNWLCMKFVNTSYTPFRDGVMPDGVSIGQNVGRSQNGTSECQKDQTFFRIRKDASLPWDSTAPKEESLMYVASELPTAEEGPQKRTAYPYFSWAPCLRCNRPRPPRCHHCPICDKCILKRDHHCFFAGACIGMHNLRHFTVFVFWALVGTLFAAFHALPFWYNDILPYTSFFDLFFPLAFLRALFGYIEWKFVICIVLGWLLVLFLLVANTYMKQSVNSIVTGRTSFETDFNMNVSDTRQPKDMVKAVFGRFWIFNFIIPLHFVLKPIEDPVRWPSIRA